MVDAAVAFGGEGGDAEGHGDAMVAKRIECGGTEALAAFDAEAVGPDVDLDAHAAKVFGHGGDAISLLDAQFARVPHFETTARGTEHGEHRDFVNQGRRQGTLQNAALNLATGDAQIADRFAAVVVEVEHFDRSADRSQKIQQGGARGVEADAFQDQVGVVGQQGGDQEKGGRGEVAGNGERLGLQLGTANQRDDARHHADVRTELAQRNLGVVTRADLLTHGGDAVRVKSAEEHAAFHLGAHHGQRIVDGLEWAARDLERRKVLVATRDMGTHFGQRLHDAAHRPAGERLVATDARGERLGGEDTGDHADGAAGIARVEVCRRGLQAAKTPTLHGDAGAVFSDFDPHRLKAAEGGMTVLPGAVILELRGALGNGGKHAVAVRDGFVARKAEGAADVAGG